MVHRLRRSPIPAPLLLCISLLGCGGETTGRPPDPVQAAAEPVGYSVHEWGLIHFGMGEERGLATAGPGHFPVPAPGTIGIGGMDAVAFKPVLYVHLEGQEEARFDAEVRVPNGTVVEHWPDGAISGEADSVEGQQVRWSGVVASNEGCRGDSYPPIGSARCSLPDGFCEAAELASYETTDAACLQVQGRRYNHLFYRAGLPSDGPLEIGLRDGTATVRNRSGHALPGRLIRVVRDSQGGVRATFTEPPPPGAQVEVPSPAISAPRNGPALMEALDEDLTAIGLTSEERQAFARAWAADLSGAPAPPSPHPVVVQRIPSAPVAPAQDALLYWLGPEHANALLPLHLDPAPLAVHRGLLVRVHLNPPPTIPAGVRVRMQLRRLEGSPQNTAVIRRVIRRHVPAIRACFDAAPTDTDLALDIPFNIQIAPDGTTGNASIEEMPALAPYRDCLAARLRAIRFPVPEHGATAFDAFFEVRGRP